MTRSPSLPGKYKVLAEIADKYTLNPGYPGNTNAAIDEIINKFLIPQMFAEVAQGKRTAEDAAKIYDRSFRGIFQKLAEPREDLDRGRAALISELGRPPGVGEAPEPQSEGKQFF